MIYFCKGCSKSCDECGKCCSSVCEPISQLIDRPLGGYVLMTGVLNVPAVALSVVGLMNKKLEECDDPVSMFCIGDAVLAAGHTCFAFYVQNRLVRGLETAAANLQGSPGGPQAKDMLSSASQIVMYDVGFCFYIFFFLGSFGFNCIGLSWVSSCLGMSAPWFAAVLLILFAIGAFWFLILWWMALVCEDCCNFGRSSSQPQQRNKGALGLFLGNVSAIPQGQGQGRHQQGDAAVNRQRTGAICGGLWRMLFGGSQSTQRPPQQRQQPAQYGASTGGPGYSGGQQGAPAGYAGAAHAEPPPGFAQPATAPPAGYGQHAPVQGYPVGGGGPPPQQGMSQQGGRVSDPPQQTTGQKAQNVAATGLGALGAGMQALGQKMQQKPQGRQ